MSAITGIFYRDGRNVDPQLIKKMNDILSHRGPDGSATWCEGPVGLGHQMLWTTHESLQETLPLEDDGLVITADARIDNRAELSQELDIEDAEHVADSYFILKAYQKWGEDCPDKLLGDFAFAIWDKNKEQLFCARDHMGVKPFYYYLSDKSFLFATELNAIKFLQEVNCDLNELSIAYYLLPLDEDKENTFYKTIYRLPPANSVIIHSKGIKKEVYWELNINKETSMGSNQEYADKFLEIFTEAVKCRMRSVVPVGSLLSGGLDSSSIVCIAHKILNEENLDYHLETFSAVFDDLPVCDEREYINEVINKANFEPNFINASKLSPLNHIDYILEKIGEPFDIPNLYIHWELFHEAKKKGINILLDGFDGDTTVFYSERYFLDLTREKQLKKLFYELKLMSKEHETNIIKLFLLTIVLPVTPEIIQKIIEKIFNLLNIQINLTEEKCFDLIKNEFIHSTNLKKHFKQIYSDPLKKAKTNKLRHHLRLSSGCFPYSLEIANIAAANFFIEPRYPFFDIRLIEFCLSLPKEQKYSQKWDRIVMRRAMDNILPTKIQWRTSKGMLGMNFRKNMLFLDEKKLEYLICKNSNLIKEYVDIKYLKKTFDKFKENESVEPLDLWLSAVLISWLKN